MKNFRPFAALSLAAAFLLPAYAQKVPVQVNDFDVFVDLPTGFAFIKTPLNWLFVRKLDATQLANLPSSTLTSLLEEESNLAETDASAKDKSSSITTDLMLAASSSAF